MNLISILFLTCFILLFTILEADRKVLSCYVTYWSVYRKGEGKFDMKYIEPHLCTHIIYAFQTINSTTWTLESSDLWADNNIGNLKKLIELKRENADLKILFCVGGWSEGSETFSAMASDEQRRQAFIASVLQKLKSNNMDGLDIDWEYPTRRGGKPDDKLNFVSLLKELRSEFDKYNYTLTVRVMGSLYAMQGYDIAAISQAVDFINLKSYSYHGTWESTTGVHSALSPRHQNDQDNVEFSVDLLLKEGAAKEKVLLGLSTEGNAFILDNPVTDADYFNQPAAKGFSGPWLEENGVMGFNEICYELNRTDGWTRRIDEASKTPYATRGDLLISYDDENSIQQKVKMVMTKGLGGASLFSLDTDDFRGNCYGEIFYLSQTARRSLKQTHFTADIFNQQLAS